MNIIHRSSYKLLGSMFLAICLMFSYSNNANAWWGHGGWNGYHGGWGYHHGWGGWRGPGVVIRPAYGYYGNPYRGRCGWVNGHWARGYWVPAHRVCY